MRGELTKKNLIFSFLFILGFSLIDAYVHPLLFARSLPFPTPVSVVVETLLFFGGGIFLCILSKNFSKLGFFTWSGVNTLSIKRLVPIYVLLLMVYIPLLLSFEGLNKFTVYTVGNQSLGAIFLIFYLSVRNTDFPQVLAVNEKGIEVILQVLIPLAAIEILSTLYKHLVSLTHMVGVIFIVSWGLVTALAFALGAGLLIGIPYYFYMKTVK